MILRPASDNAQFMRPGIVIRFPTPDVEKSVVVGCPSHLIKHRNIIELGSCITSESRKIFKRVFYLKQINFITGGPLAAGGPGQLPPLPPLNPALCVSGFRVDCCHDRAPFTLIAVVALFMVPVFI